MTQFFNHQEAESFRSDVMEHFPQLSVQVVRDIHEQLPDGGRGEYKYSYFSVYLMDGTDILHHVYVNSEEDWNGMLLFSRYIARTIVDNQQSEEYDHSVAEKAMMKYADWKNLSQQERFERHIDLEI